ncbi:hypothetical protein RRG08_009035 [Elysia crispata]|uniref:Phosphoinositide phospholipase C n=1 Tax=Elysia crispata TaxID=231223 RepID=A0AAE1CJ22_9GAST|nr:hypothetical protein RRG08_009035 [Elysia crispata]
MASPHRTKPYTELTSLTNGPPRYLDQRAFVERVLAELGQGTSLFKVKSPTKMLERTFYLDMKNMCVYYDGSKKKNRDTSVRISKIREVREGEKDFSKKLKDLEKNLCFVIILGSTQRALYMMAEKQQTRDKWVRGLRYAIQIDQLAEQRNETDRNIRDAFNMADKNGDGSLDFDEVLKLLKTLNADVKKKYAREMFDAADTNKNGKGNNSVLDREEFVNFYHRLTKRVEVEEVFLRFSRGKGFMTLKDILTFLREGQKMKNVTDEDGRNVLDQFEPDKGLKMREHMSADAFRKLITSERQQLFNPAHKLIYQDMTRPMTDYFIDSSHNTYLAEDQLKGPSKVEMYIEALQKGCRCVELDCWDGSDGEPVIYHGHTLTSKIKFEDVIKAVNNYAFESSAYPVTLSLENHCSIEQQEVMAQMMNSILGDKIWRPQADMIHIPSPEELKNKIVIKGKKLSKAAEEEHNDDVSDEDEAAEVPTNSEGDNTDGDGHNTTSSTNNNNNNHTGTQERRKSQSSESKKIKLDRQLSLITTMKSVGLKTVENNPEPVSNFTVISIGESKTEKMIHSSPNNLNTITHHRIVRTYPSGTRTDSSNYNPVPMWNHGCQIVALNYQTPGEAMQLNHGRFLDNGRTGYVLKPDFLLSDEHFGLVTGAKDRGVCKNLKITIISGFQIPKPNDSEKGEVIDPFVKVELYGVAADANEFKTKVIENNGFNPRWYETCMFQVTVPELAMVRFTVIDQDRARDDFIGYYCLPVMSIQEGFRHFPLFDQHGAPFKQSLIFTHVTLTDA